MPRDHREGRRRVTEPLRLRTILVSMDFSTTTDRALEVATELAR